VALLGAAAGYLLLTLLVTWPLVLDFGSAAPGLGDWGGERLHFDSPVALWDLWWFRYALVHLHQSPFRCAYLFHPWGADLRLHTLAPLPGAIGLVLQEWLTLGATHNVLLLANFVAAGLTTRALARRLGARDGAAFLAGAAYAFAPPVVAHLWVGHWELVSTAWLPGALLIFLALIGYPDPPRAPSAESAEPKISDPTFRRSLLYGGGLGVLGVATFYTAQYYALYLVELLAVVAAVLAPRLARRQVLAGLALAAAIAVAGVAPLLPAYLSPAARAPAPPSPLSDFERHSGDLLAIVVPPFQHPLWAGRPNALLDRLHSPRGAAGFRGEPEPQETTTFAGWSLLALAALGLRQCWQSADRERRGLLLAIVVVFMVLALGSRLKVNGIPTGLPLPAALLEHVPVLRQARAPGRHAVVAALGLSLLAALGWQGLRRPWLRVALLAGVVLDLAVMPLPLWSTDLSPAYDRVAALHDTALLEIPFGARDGTVQLGASDGNEMFAQTRHHLPLVGGVVSRLPAATWRALLAAPVIGTLARPTPPSPATVARDRRDGPPWFAGAGIRTILVHPAAVGSAQHRYVERVLPVATRERAPDGTLILRLAARSG
jgi:hypothetical protein